MYQVYMEELQDLMYLLHMIQLCVQGECPLDHQPCCAPNGDCTTCLTLGEEE